MMGCEQTQVTIGRRVLLRMLIQKKQALEFLNLTTIFLKFFLKHFQNKETIAGLATTLCLLLSTNTNSHATPLFGGLAGLA